MRVKFVWEGKMETTISLITMIATLITSITAFIAIAQLSIMKNSFIQDHERSRREKAIEYIFEWVRYTSDGTAAKGLVERLDEKQCTKLWKEQEFEVDVKYKNYLERGIKDFGVTEISTSGNTIIIDCNQSALIRKRVIAYLNMTEMVIASAYNCVADKDIIMAEFSPLVCEEKNIHLLANLRKVAGGKTTYPYIEKFVKEVECDDIVIKEKLGQLNVLNKNKHKNK